jgi:dinuclear metal center YbgI/SA1388 family protein
MGTIVERGQLSAYLNEWLRVEQFKDYSLNGLQVEGKPRIARVACAVTATLDVIGTAVEWGADALIVHHGWFWRGEESRIVGMRHRRIRTLMQADINLFAYHHPLDAHPEVGNNVMFGLALGWPKPELLGAHGLVARAHLPESVSSDTVLRELETALGRRPLAVGALGRSIRTLSWCTGAAQDLLEEAVALGADAFVSGEISKRTTHAARESGVVYSAAGHYASERFGIQALGMHLHRTFGVAWRIFRRPQPGLKVRTRLVPRPTDAD